MSEVKTKDVLIALFWGLMELITVIPAGIILLVRGDLPKWYQFIIKQNQA